MKSILCLFPEPYPAGTGGAPCGGKDGARVWRRACLNPAVYSKPSPVNPVPLLTQEVRHADGKTERVFGDGRREVAFANGTLRLQLPDGRAVVRFTNGDVKKTFPGCAPARATCQE